MKTRIPVRTNPLISRPTPVQRPPIALGRALAIVAVLTAGLTWTPGILTGPAAMQGSARGTAVVVASAALISVLSMAVNRHRPHLGLMLWLGSVAYLVYNAVMFVFATPYNRLFLLDVTFLGLAVFTLIALVSRLSGGSVAQPPRVRRWLAVGIWAVVALNAGAWLISVVPSLWSERPEAVVDGLGVATNPVYVQDLAFWLPAAVMIGRWLWIGRPTGVLLTGGLLGLWVLESISIAVDQALGVAADPNSPVVSTTVIPAFVILAALQAAAFVLHARTTRAS